MTIKTCDIVGLKFSDHMKDGFGYLIDFCE